jgi:putative hemolysin
MKRRDLLRRQWVVYLILIAVFSAGCSQGQVEPVDSGVGVPNPSANYCDKLGYEYENGECVFQDGTKCDSWAFYRGTCGQEKTYCEQQGFRIENRVEEVGSATYAYAVCVFSDGSECLEEEYLAGECSPSECEEWLLSKDGCVANK